MEKNLATLNGIAARIFHNEQVNEGADHSRGSFFTKTKKNWGQCYDQYFRRFWQTFGEKMAGFFYYLKPKL
jgi:hypothetical protein